MDMVFIPCPSNVYCWIYLKLVLVVYSIKFVNENRHSHGRCNILNLLKQTCTWIYRFGTNHNSTNLFCWEMNYPANCFILSTSFHNVCMLKRRDPPDAARIKQPKKTRRRVQIMQPLYPQHHDLISSFWCYFLPLRGNILFNTFWNTFSQRSSLTVTGK